MLISHKHRFLFIHIYKNAGTSITRALMPFACSIWTRMIDRALKRIRISIPYGHRPFPSHIKASEIVSAMGRQKFNAYFSFAIVRNPWDWQVSLYKYMLKNKAHYQNKFIKGFSSFDAYIRWRCKNEANFQKDFIYSKENQMLINFVGKFETLDNDFKNICSRIGISASLPKLNISNSIPYRAYYNNETKELVRQTFGPDIRLFQYEF